MDRRDLLKKSVAGMTLAAGVKSAEAQDVYAGVIIPGEKYSDGRAGDVSNAVEDHLKVEGYVKEPSHRIPVVLSADVAVVGRHKVLLIHPPADLADQLLRLVVRRITLHFVHVSPAPVCIVGLIV